MTCQDSFHEVAFNISFWTRNISSARILFWRGVYFQMGINLNNIMLSNIIKKSLKMVQIYIYILILILIRLMIVVVTHTLIWIFYKNYIYLYNFKSIMKSTSDDIIFFSIFVNITYVIFSLWYSSLQWLLIKWCSYHTENHMVLHFLH